MTEQTAVLHQDPPLLPPPASPDRAHRVPGDRTAIPGLHDPVASARVVVEVECGILVYPPEEAGEPWRAVFTENGRRRFRQAMTEAELAAKLAKVTERLRACAPDMERPGADLIAHYLDPDRLPVAKRWSRRHADTQRGCASGSPPRSSPGSPARTSPPVTCSRSSAPRRPPARASGCTGACPPWSPRASRAGT